MIARPISIAAFCMAAAVAVPYASAEAKPYRDAERGFTIAVPEGWSAFDGGLMTTSPDSKVRCTVAVSPNAATSGLPQDQVNADAAATYTPIFWERQFFVGGASGAIDDSGVATFDAFQAPWAKGTVEYPRSALANFEIVMVPAPGKVATVTCVGEPEPYAANQAGVTAVINSLRPLGSQPLPHTDWAR
jgi:hypothetical protein